jgi:hypothetical protein
MLYRGIDIDGEGLPRAEEAHELRFGGTPKSAQPALRRRSEVFQVHHDLVQEKGNYWKNRDQYDRHLA